MKLKTRCKRDELMEQEMTFLENWYEGMERIVVGDYLKKCLKVAVENECVDIFRRRYEEDVRTGGRMI